MAIFHLSIKIISRGKGKSAVAAAAYRAGTLIKSEYDGIVNDYTRKGGVVHTEILLPQNAPPEYMNRATLWNAVEMGERNKNAQLAREIELALPSELTLTQNRTLVKAYCQEQFVDNGMCADICIHDTGRGNPHAHIMLTVRPIGPSGAWGAKSRKEYVLDENGERIKLKNGAYKTSKVSTVDWNEPTKAEHWRTAWAEAVNSTLEYYGHEVRIDNRSFERQGKEEIPTVHLGVATSQMERKGMATNRGCINREVAVFNSDLKKLQKRIDEMKNWLKILSPKNEPTEPTNLVHMVQRIIARQEEKRKASQYPERIEVKIFEETLDFLDKHGIKTIDDFKGKAAGLHNRNELMRFEEMRGRIMVLLRQESRNAQKEQQKQGQPRARGRGR